MEYFNLLEKSSLEGNFKNKKNDLEELKKICGDDDFLNNIIDEAIKNNLFDKNGKLPKNLSNLKNFCKNLGEVYYQENLKNKRI